MSFSDYAPVDVRSPLDGLAITIFNLRSDKLGLVDQFETNSSNNTRRYNGFDLSVDARPRSGTTLFGGLVVSGTFQRYPGNPVNVQAAGNVASPAVGPYGTPSLTRGTISVLIRPVHRFGVAYLSWLPPLPFVRRVTWAAFVSPRCSWPRF